MPGGKLSFSIRFNPDNVVIKGKKVRESSEWIGVYIDPQLKQRAPEARVSVKGRQITIGPDKAEGYPAAGNENPLFTSKSWVSSERYYIAMSLDPTSGKWLEKPMISEFEVKPQLEKPVIRVSVDSNGFLNLSWQKIDGAERYFITRLDTLPGAHAAIATTLAEVSQTTWSSETFEHVSAPMEAYHQNDPLVALISGEDLPENAKAEKSIGVVAQGAGGTSWAMIDPSILAHVPLKAAISSLKTAGPDGNMALSSVPKTLPVLMADGRIQENKVIYDLSTSVELQSYVQAVDSSGNAFTLKVPAVSVAFKVENSCWSGGYQQAGHTIEEAHQLLESSAK